jgi:hypothetical protein
MLKWVAIVSMTIDHIGVVLYPEFTVLRMIGRLALPLFSYLIVLGIKKFEGCVALLYAAVRLRSHIPGPILPCSGRNAIRLI